MQALPEGPFEAYGVLAVWLSCHAKGAAVAMEQWGCIFDQVPYNDAFEDEDLGEKIEQVDLIGGRVEAVLSYCTLMLNSDQQVWPRLPFEASYLVAFFLARVLAIERKALRALMLIQAEGDVPVPP